MFSFFSEVCDFFSQIAYNLNWVHDFVMSFLTTSSDVLVVVSDFSSQLPPQISWILPATAGGMVFHFIRGR